MCEYTFTKTVTYEKELSIISFFKFFKYQLILPSVTFFSFLLLGTEQISWPIKKPKRKTKPQISNRNADTTVAIMAQDGQYFEGRGREKPLCNLCLNLGSTDKKGLTWIMWRCHLSNDTRGKDKSPLTLVMRHSFITLTAGGLWLSMCAFFFIFFILW